MTQARMLGVSHVGRLKEFLDEDRSNKDVLGYLVSDGRSRTLNALKAPDVPATQTACWLSVISKALRCESDKDMVIDLLTMVLGSRFFSSGITNALSTLARNSSEEDIVIFVQDLVDIINQIFIRLPHSLADVFGHIVIIKKTIDDILPTTTDCNKRRFSVLSHTTESLKETALNRMSVFNRGHGKTKSEPHQPPNDFRTIPILPETSDIFLNSRKVYLRKNKAVGEYESLDHYLDVQFRLYREDCVSPLRDGIAEYVSAVDSGQHISRLQDGKLYKNVVVISRKSAIEGEQYVIKLDKEHASKFNWKSCQRLIYGSLVCLSGDNFRKMHFAVVSDSDREILQVKNEFAVVCPANDILPINTKMTMVESAAFFEAYRHVLAGLQNIGEGELPFEKYIVKCRKDVDPPVYLTKAATEYDLQPIILNQTIFEKSKTLQRESNWRKKEEHDSLKKQYMVQTLSPISQWPKCDKLHLDQSQFEAFYAALTQELVLIQGPPGTGKTHVGLQIAKTLLHNKDVWATDTTTKGGFRVKRKWPMLVVCFTNHALDQFMEGIINFLCPLSKSSWRNEIVRVGGRCENETIEEFSLKKRRRFFRRGRWDEAGTFKTVQSLQQKIADTKYRLRELKSVIFDVLLLHPVMSANNYSAFNHNKFGSHLLFQWLGADETTWLQGAQTAYFQKQLDPTRTAQVENWKAQMQQELLNVKSDADILEDDRRIEDDTVASLTVDKNIGLDMKSIISIMLPEG
ncbi:NFX1-type zinc finger-containing protein 1-like [Argopecten irradians]|uniref:NFX1-type zinc finger-containing protein 1-like n=1 Tax=Argopecten irradians TaxID=31199 RepID=UPI0037233289